MKRRQRRERVKCNTAKAFSIRGQKKGEGGAYVAKKRVGSLQKQSRMLTRSGPVKERRRSRAAEPRISCGKVRKQMIRNGANENVKGGVGEA